LVSKLVTLRLINNSFIKCLLGVSDLSGNSIVDSIGYQAGNPFNNSICFPNLVDNTCLVRFCKLGISLLSKRICLPKLLVVEYTHGCSSSCSKIGLILSKIKDRLKPDEELTLAKKIDRAVFPGTQGGPLDHAIAAKAICFLEALKPDFKEYQKQIILNAKAMADEFKKLGIRVISNGTDNHLMVIDISPFGVDSIQIQEELDKVCISVNRNVVPFDKRPFFNPSGIRLGSPAITSRGIKEKEARKITQLIVRLIKNLDNQEVKKQIKEEVKKIVKKFPIYETLS